MHVVLRTGVHAELRRRQVDDEPALASVDVRELQGVAKEGAVRSALRLSMIT